jgi:hypothetical protein
VGSWIVTTNDRVPAAQAAALAEGRAMTFEQAVEYALAEGVAQRR